jgi:hypothetical protein
MGGVLIVGLWWIRIEGEGPLADGLVGWVLLNWGGKVNLKCEQCRHPRLPHRLISSRLDGGPLRPQILRV